MIYVNIILKRIGTWMRLVEIFYFERQFLDRTIRFFETKFVLQIYLVKSRRKNTIKSQFYESLVKIQLKADSMNLWGKLHSNELSSTPFNN
jgi:hypothetical protein